MVLCEGQPIRPELAQAKIPIDIKDTKMIIETLLFMLLDI
jgi:hypothetical protein